MLIPETIIANADDFGLNAAVNKAILFCFQHGYINSTSLLTNTTGFQEAVQMTKLHASIKNVGVHINLAEGKPLTRITTGLLNESGDWNLQKTGKAASVFSTTQKQEIKKEIFTQVEKSLAQGITITHIDSHYHLHTLPGLYPYFLAAAKYFNLKLRLAQTYRAGSYPKYWYRAFLNYKISNHHLNYSQRFETVEYFLNNITNGPKESIVEVMLHPSFDPDGTLTDHYDKATMANWLNYLKQLHRS